MAPPILLPMLFAPAMLVPTRAPTARMAVAPPTSSTIIVGGGPAGLATAIMLAKRGWKDITVLDRLEAPPAPDDTEEWSDTARHYLIGLGGRGQIALDTLGAWPSLEPFCADVKGRKDWAPNSEDGVERIFTDRAHSTRVIPRGRIVACLQRHIEQTYNDAITLRHGVEVSGIEWEGDESAVLTCEPCAAEGDAEACAAVDEAADGASSYEMSAGLVIGADGARRTIASAIEADEAATKSQYWWQRLGMGRMASSFRVVKFEDTSVRVYKTVPLNPPASWSREINYSARTPTVNFDALPTLGGEYCGVLLIKPDDEQATEGLADVPAARSYFEEMLPQFSDSISDEALAQVIAKPPSRLPLFRYVGPRLHHKASTVLLGDAIHSVKPYFGLGVNSAFEDVVSLGDALDEQPTVGKALQQFSKVRGPEARCLVELSRSFDRSGLAAFVTFILPLILDGIFHGMLPKVFAPNTLAMLQKPELTFQHIRWRKRLDRAAQLALLATVTTGAFKLVSAVVGAVARFALARRLEGWTVGVPIAAAAVATLLRFCRQQPRDVADVLAASTSAAEQAEEPEPAPEPAPA